MSTPSSDTLAQELVEKIDRVIRLAATEDHYRPASEAESIIAEGREALAEIAAFFEVDLPSAAS